MRQACVCLRRDVNLNFNVELREGKHMESVEWNIWKMMTSSKIRRDFENNDHKKLVTTAGAQRTRPAVLH